MFPIQGIMERRVSKERIGGGMGDGKRSRKEGEGEGIQPGARRGEEGVETRSGKWKGSRMWREASGEGTRRSKRVGVVRVVCRGEERGLTEVKKERGWRTWVVEEEEERRRERQVVVG